ncbi:MAG: hypothetical protein ACYC7B_15610 [Burkholderiales bacterium]
MALPFIDFNAVGPAVGNRFPDIRLPNQHGTSIDLHVARAGRQALVAFIRSAGW